MKMSDCFFFFSIHACLVVVCVKSSEIQYLNVDSVICTGSEMNDFIEPDEMDLSSVQLCVYMCVGITGAN